MIGHRHLYTRAPEGALGGPGFQAVAASASLDDEERRTLDDLAGRAVPDPDLPHRTLLLQPFPTDAAHCVLTRVTPREDSFDDRPGNHWVESVVVPRRWLARGGWDPAAAFAALDWWGAEKGLREIADRGGTPAELEDLELPPLDAPLPGDGALLERLSRLPGLVPDAPLRRALLAGFAAQAMEDRDPPSPLLVVAGDDGRLDELTELLLLLPVALPPTLRSRTTEAGARRCLRLTTLGRTGSLPGADLVGLPERDLEHARGLPGTLVDLGGAIEPPSPGGEAAELARRLDEALAAGDGDALADLHRGRREGGAGGTAAEGPAPAGDREARQGLAEPGGRPPAARPQSGMPEGAAGAGTSPLAPDREALWSQREAAEAEVGALLELLRRDRESLLADVRTLVERQGEAMRQEAERLRSDLTEGRLDGKRSLQEEAAKLREEIRETIDDGLEVLRRAGADRVGAYSNRLNQLLGQLDSRHGEAVAELEARYRRSANELHRVEMAAHQRLGTADDLPAAAKQVPYPEERRSDGGGRRDRPAGVPGGSWPGATAGFGRVGSWLRRRRVWITLVSLLAAVAVVALAWVAWPDSGPGGSDPISTRDSGASTGTTPATDGRDRAITAVLRNGVAETLLRRAAGNPALADRAAEAWILVVLGPDRPLPETASCALVQQVARDRLVELGRESIPVDGQCGAGSQAAVATVGPALGCDRGPWREQAACILERHLAPERAEPCSASWPLVRDCRWSAGEAARFLALLREAAGATEAVDRAAWDLAAAPDLAGEIPDGLDRSDGQALLPLAHLAERAAAGALSAPGPGGTAPWPGELSEDDLRRTAGFLDGLAGDGPGTDSGPDAGGGDAR